jgi:hypothetical protein
MEESSRIHQRSTHVRPRLEQLSSIAPRHTPPHHDVTTHEPHARDFNPAHAPNAPHTPPLPDRFVRVRGDSKRSLFLYRDHTPQHGASMGLILVILLVLLLVGGLPTWGYSKNWGYRPTGGLGLLLVIVIILLLVGVIPRGF